MFPLDEAIFYSELAALYFSDSLRFVGAVRLVYRVDYCGQIAKLALFSLWKMVLETHAPSERVKYG